MSDVTDGDPGRRPIPDPDPDRGRPVEPAPTGSYVDDEWYEEADEDGYYDTGTWVEYAPPTSKGRRVLATILVILGIVAVAAGSLYFWVQRQIDPPGEPGETIALVIPEGATTEDIGRLLADEDVITNASVWNYYVRFKDVGGFAFGDYEFQRNSSFEEAIVVLEGGPRPPESERVSIPEGFTVVETVARLTDPERGLARWNAEVMNAALTSGEIRSAFQPEGVSSMEGFLFPETYEVGDDEDERAFIRRLVAQTDSVLIGLGVEAKADTLGVTPYQVMIIASLIEEEARVEEDRTKISRVIYNRLEQGIPLGIDATNRYEAELAGRSRDDIDFSSDSPYNTRRVLGLPPTPIAAPGRASIEAALDPEPGSWTFYVLKNAAGEHFFTDSNNEFLQAKAECKRLGLGCG